MEIKMDIKKDDTKLYEVEFDIEKREGEINYSFLKVHIRTNAEDEDSIIQEAIDYANKVLGIEASRLEFLLLDEL